jgi:hypothetical protein
VVPNITRTQLVADPRFEAAAAVARVAASLDVAQGLSLLVSGELSTAKLASSLAVQLERYLLEVRQSPQMLLLGLGPWLQGVHVVAKGPQVQARLDLPPDQTQVLAERLAGLLAAP